MDLLLGDLTLERAHHDPWSAQFEAVHLCLDQSELRALSAVS